MTESDRDAQDVTLYDRYVAVMNKGPRTADAIGEALWQVQERRLYRHVFGSMRTFYSLCAKMEAEEGAKLIEEWKASTRGRAVLAQNLKGREADVAPSDRPGSIVPIAVVVKKPSTKEPTGVERPVDQKTSETAPLSQPGLPPMTGTSKDQKVVTPHPSSLKAESIPADGQTGIAGRGRRVERAVQPAKSKKSKTPDESQPAPAAPAIMTHEPPARAVKNPASVDGWAARIAEQIGKSAQSLVALGQLFLDAKADLKHGLWEELFNSGKVSFSLRMAQRLMRLARNPALTNATNSSLLPPSLETLTILARLDPEVVQGGIDAGRIRPDTSIAAAQLFVSDQPESGPAKTGKSFVFDRALKLLVKKVKLALEKVPMDDRQKFTKSLVKEINEPATAS